MPLYDGTYITNEFTTTLNEFICLARFVAVILESMHLLSSSYQLFVKALEVNMRGMSLRAVLGNVFFCIFKRKINNLNSDIIELRLNSFIKC